MRHVGDDGHVLPRPVGAIEIASRINMDRFIFTRRNIDDGRFKRIETDYAHNPLATSGNDTTRVHLHKNWLFNLQFTNRQLFRAAESAFDFRRDSRNVHFAKRVQIQIVRNALVQHETTGTGIQNERTDVSTVDVRSN